MISFWKFKQFNLGEYKNRGIEPLLKYVEIAWLEFFLHELDVDIFYCPIIWCDNQSVSSLIANLIYHA